MPTPPPTIPVNFVDNPHAPDVFATGISGFAMFFGNVSISFESARVDHSTAPGPVNRVLIGRLVLPVQIAQQLSLALHSYLVDQGLDPTAAVTQGQTPQ